MSLDICTNEDDHFIIEMREKATGDIYDVKCVTDLGFFYTGYTPQYTILFKDAWELVRPEPEPRSQPQNRVLTFIGILGGTFTLALMLGCIIRILMG